MPVKRQQTTAVSLMNYSMIGVIIMAKKRLTDLLREEVEKSPDLESATVGKTSDDQPIDQNTETVHQLPMSTPPKSSTSTRHSTPTKAELETTVTELQAALEEAQQKEAAFADLKNALEESHKKESELQHQITELQSDLYNQNKSLQKLQKELEKITEIKAELEQAKKAASQLAKANEKLNSEIEALKKENEDVKVPLIKQPEHRPGRPIQKGSENPGDFAKNSWLL